MSVNRIQIRVKPGEKNITVPLGQIFDEVGREQLITDYEEVELQDAVNVIQDYETTRYYYDNDGVDLESKIFSEFKFFDRVAQNYGANSINFNNAGFTDSELYRNKKSFTNSFWKFDYYDTPVREEQKLMFTIVLPTTNCNKYEVPIDPLEDPVAYYQLQSQGLPTNYDVWYPKVQLGPTSGKDESYYIHWLKNRDLFEIETFYMSCKFFNAKTGNVVRFLNADPTGNVEALEPTNWFYYQVDIQINELTTPKYSYKVREFNNNAYSLGIVLNEAGMNPSPNQIRWYEYI
tara:strand:+ start:70 stop:939 length:870 start_codon:yes stop_codon:yes gene_type:complete